MIVCAACKYEDIIFCGARHFDKVMRSQMSHNMTSAYEQGFIDHMGVFYDRKDALIHAKACGQAIDYTRNGSTKILYSEGLY